MARNKPKSMTGEGRYDSKARRVLIPEFNLLRLEFQPAEKDVYQYDVPDYEFSEESGGYYPNFPVLIQGDGEPWEIGNLYLTTKLTAEHSYESRTYRGIADHLLDYLRFLEDEGLDFLFFPRMNRRKVTYRYRQRLMDQVTNGELSISTARGRINAVISFYRFIMEFRLIDQEQFKHEPFADVWRYINPVSEEGRTTLLRIKSHNLAVSVPKKQRQSEYINDGGDLRPLPVSDQELVLKALLDSSREYQLIFYFALFTGARIQTIGTLRVKHLKGDLDNEGYLRLPIGAGTKIDTKRGKPMMLLVPGWLVTDMLIYTSSPEATKRRKRSYYGDTEDNYVFLTKNGTSFYTSKKEMLDRRNQRISSFASMADRAQHVVLQDGGSIRMFIKEVLLKRIRCHHPNFQGFTFHDLRATFGMNLLQAQLNHMGDQAMAKALDYVQQRMGHRDKATTMQYLNYKTRLDWKAAIEHEFESGLFKYVNSAHQPRKHRN